SPGYPRWGAGSGTGAWSGPGSRIRRAIRHQITIWGRASNSVNGGRAHTPIPCAVAPASQGSAAPPTTDPAFITPIAVGTSRADGSRGTPAIAGGKLGRRKNPSSTRPTLAAAADGTSQVTAAARPTPLRHPKVIPTGVSPIRPAAGLIRNRPKV